MNKIFKRHLFFTFIFAVSSLLFVCAVSLVRGTYVQVMTKDVAALANMHPLSGFLSNLGVLLWCVVLAICFFVASTISNDNYGKERSFLYSSSILTAYLMFDDLFQIHEYLAPKYLRINEKVIYLVLGVYVIFYMFQFRKIILKTRFSILALSFVFLGSSVVVDSLFHGVLQKIGHWEYLVEDGTKWFGIVAWCSYYVDTSYRILNYSFKSSVEVH